MGLVKDTCLLPTRDAPELGYVKESSDKQYVPDVFYKQKDEYGNEVTRLARPLPVEYLLVNVSVSTPKVPRSTFVVQETIEKFFPVENRLVDGHTQDFNAFARYLNQFSSTTSFLEIASDFHFLVYIATMDIVDLRPALGPLLEAIKSNDSIKANEWRQLECWGTVATIVESSSIAPSSLGAAGSSSRTQQVIAPQALWTCTHCTYNNSNNGPNCEVCQLPRA
jgi:nuclear protein localization family protein 4